MRRWLKRLLSSWKVSLQSPGLVLFILNFIKLISVWGVEIPIRTIIIIFLIGRGRGRGREGERERER